MTTTIYGASDNLIEFDGAIHGEITWTSSDHAEIKLTAPGHGDMRLTAQFGGAQNPDGWMVSVVDNHSAWPVEPFVTSTSDGTLNHGVRIETPDGTTATCDGKPVLEAVLKACPECLAGKHGNCNGETWDEDHDTTTGCPCYRAGHTTDPAEERS